MGSVVLIVRTKKVIYYQNSRCQDQDAAKVAKSRTSQNPGHRELAFSSLLDVSIVCFAKETTPKELELVLLFTCQRSWNIWQLKFLNLLATLPGTIRKRG